MILLENSYIYRYSRIKHVLTVKSWTEPNFGLDGRFGSNMGTHQGRIYPGANQGIALGGKFYRAVEFWVIRWLKKKQKNYFDSIKVCFYIDNDVLYISFFFYQTKLYVYIGNNS